MILKYNPSSGNIELIEIEIEIKNIGKHGFWAKTLGVNDNIILPIENIRLVIAPTKLNRGIGEKDSEEPRIIKGSKYKLILKRI